MALTQKLEFRQSQALVLTPQLMQAIKLLQLSNLDLTTYVENELERNPLLERTDGDEWLGEELETSRGASESNLGTGLDNVFPDDAAAPAERLHAQEPAAYSEWSGV